MEDNSGVNPADIWSHSRTIHRQRYQCRGWRQARKQRRAFISNRQSGIFKWLIASKLWFGDTQKVQKIKHLAHTVAGCLLPHYNPSADSSAWHCFSCLVSSTASTPAGTIFNNKANIVILIFWSNFKYLLANPIARFARQFSIPYVNALDFFSLHYMYFNKCTI